MQDALAGIKTVKLSGAEQREVSRFSQISDEAYRDFVARTKMANRYVFWENMLTRLSQRWCWLWWVSHPGTPTHAGRCGDVCGVLDRLYGPIDALASLWVNLQQNIASIARAFRAGRSKARREERRRLGNHPGQNRV